MNCIIVDDDELIRIDLERKIAGIPFLHLVGTCASATEAADLLMRTLVDLVFLDIMMPGMNGLQFLGSLSNQRPQVILVTSEKQYAAESYDYQVTDFIVKPVSDERFLKAVMRAAAKHNAVPEAAQGRSNHLFVKYNGALARVETEDILYIEAHADYVTIHTAAQGYTVHSTMKTLQESLPEDKFFRVHNSFIINLDKISQIEDNLIKVDKKLIPVSRSRVKSLMQRLNMIQ